MLAEWPCSGLQIRLPRFDSGTRLHRLRWKCDATLAQLVERNLAKVEVTSSNLVCRSKLKNMAEWRYSQMVSYPSQEIACPGGGIGRHKGFKIPRRSRCAGSSPARGTIYKKTDFLVGFFSSVLCSSTYLPTYLLDEECAFFPIFFKP